MKDPASYQLDCQSSRDLLIAKDLLVWYRLLPLILAATVLKLQTTLITKIIPIIFKTEIAIIKPLDFSAILLPIIIVTARDTILLFLI